MSSLAHLAEALAHAFLSGEWHVRVMMARGAHACAEPPLRTPQREFMRALRARPNDAATRDAWLRELALEVRQRWSEPPLHDAGALVDFLVQHPAVRDAWETGVVSDAPRLLGWHPRMAASRWPVPVGDLRDWLRLDDGELEWFADRKGLLTRAVDGPLQHYTRRWIPRGVRLPRLLEAPKQRLKHLQRRILDELLAKVPAHDAAHGFVAGRSVKTHAALHVHQPVVVRFDLQSFFTWVQPRRALGLFRALGYSPKVASLLRIRSARAVP